MGLFDKFKRKIPPMVQVFYNQDFGFLIVPNAVEKTMGCHISIEPTEKVMPDCSSDDFHRLRENPERVIALEPVGLPFFLYWDDRFCSTR